MNGKDDKSHTRLFFFGENDVSLRSLSNPKSRMLMNDKQWK